MVYIDQLDTYERGSEIAKKLIGIETNDTAIYRLTDAAGRLSKSLLSSHQNLDKIEEKGQQGVLNIQVDGSMISTREGSWREVKPGRLFHTPFVQNTDNESIIKKSEYLATWVHIKNLKHKWTNCYSVIEEGKTQWYSLVTEHHG